MASNYLEQKGGNPFFLPAPPAWWLQAMKDFDSQLVLFPSRVRQGYVMARRRFKTLARPDLLKLDESTLRMQAGQDGATMATHKLIFVQHLYLGGTRIWNTLVFEDLRGRDTFEAGGGEKFVQRLEASEAEQDRRAKALLLDDLDQRARDAYRSYKARSGERIVVPGTATIRPSSGSTGIVSLA